MFEFQLFDSTNHPNPLHLWFGIIQDLAQVHERLLVSAIRLPTTAFMRTYRQLTDCKRNLSRPEFAVHCETLRIKLWQELVLSRWLLLDGSTNPYQ